MKLFDRIKIKYKLTFGFGLMALLPLLIVYLFDLDVGPLTMLVATLLGMMLGKLQADDLGHPIAQLSKSIAEISASGDFSTQLNGGDRQDIIGHSVNCLNHMLRRMDSEITAVSKVMNGVAEGDFSHRVEQQMIGSFNDLKQATNSSIDSLENTMLALQQVMQSLEDGDFSARMGSEIEGQFAAKVNGAMASMDHAFVEIGDVMLAMAKGDFDARVDSDMAGDLLQLKHNVNQSMTALASAVTEVTTVSEAMNEGDLTQTMDGEYQGQLGLIAHSLNATNNNLAAMVNEVRELAEQVNRGASEIDKGGQDLTNRTADQAASLEETAASMEQMASTVKLNSDNAIRADEMMQKSLEQTKASTKVVADAVKATEDIAQASQKIADIISIIDGIAFQTNLLALNASVEAARAGEHGRGFAVVAGEVRTLAQRTAEAAKDIDSLISDSVERVTLGNQLVQNTGEALHGISQSIDKVATTVATIASASREQAAGIEQVNMTVGQLDSINQQNSALVEESAAATSSLMQQAAELNQTMAYFHTSKTA